MRPTESWNNVHIVGTLLVSATEYHLGTLKAKLAKYRSQLLEPTGKKGEKGEGFDVLKSGDARVAMIGFPSVGKVRCGIQADASTTFGTYSPDDCPKWVPV